jgi:serine/threonine protein kinase
MPEVMKTVGRYEILREVGRGGMAMVYLARQSDLDRFVALKELGAFHASDPSFAQRFLRESRVAGSLSHPNIVTVHDYFEHDGTPYIAMEYVERGSLRPYVGHMTFAQISGVLEGLLAGLTHAESHGIVHRDLKPENLMVTADGRVKVADFGIAKATTRMQTGAFLTATGTTVGTPTYMAPEQAMAQDIGPWTDLYSVGCMAFELFTGNVPFHDSDAPMAILLRHVNEPIPAVKSIVPEVDQRVSDWIQQLLVKDPTQRTQNAQDAWDDFEEIVLALHGPRWRREARLVERVTESHDAKPLTPAPFQGTTAGEPGSEEFKSFAWGAPAGDTGAGSAPPMYTPPPSASAPAPPEPVVGPPTPLPSSAIPVPDQEIREETGFVTFGAPAPAPPTDALIPPPAAPADAAPAVTPPPAEPEAASPSAVTPPPAEAVRPFETYIAPEPSRPPVHGGGLTEPPAAAAPPPAPPVDTPAPEPIAETVMPRALRDAPPAAPPQERSSRRWVIPAAVAAGVLVVVLLVVVLAGGGRGPKPAATATPAKTAKPPASPVVVSAPGISLQVPGGWTRADKPAGIPGFTSGAVTMTGPGDAGIEVGQADKSAANSTLLSKKVISANGSVPAKQTAALADGVRAYRYDGVNAGGRTGSIYAVPTSSGVITLACSAPGNTCASIASTLKLTSGKTFPLGPSKSYLGRFTGVLSTLSKRENSAASTLRRAKTRTGQASATARLASAYSAAGRSLSRLSLSPADVLANARLATALKATGSAYAKAASQARNKDRAGYAQKGRTAVKAHGGVTAALQGLKAAGYAVPASLLSHFAKPVRLPTLHRDPVVRSTPQTSTPVTPSATVAPVQTAQPVIPQPTAAPPSTTGGGSGGGVGGGGGAVSGGGEG